MILHNLHTCTIVSLKLWCFVNFFWNNGSAVPLYIFIFNNFNFKIILNALFGNFAPAIPIVFFRRPSTDPAWPGLSCGKPGWLNKTKREGRIWRLLGDLPRQCWLNEWQEEHVACETTSSAFHKSHMEMWECCLMWWCFV